MFVMMLFFYGMANAQNYFHMNITEIQHGEVLKFCISQCDGVIIEKESGCEEWLWHVQIINGESYDYETDEITLLPLLTSYYHIRYMSECGISLREFDVKFMEFQANEPFTQDYMWKRPGESITLWAGGDGYSCQWSTGSTEYNITVTEPDTYWVRVYNDCGELYDTIQVRDNVELYRATCDLRSNLNQVTWQTTPAQAEYISQVKVYRNTYQLVATVPYLDGSFTDDIGSESTQWQYHIVGVDTNGNDCPIPSYWKRTIHLDHVQGTGGGEILQWTPYEEENPSKDVVVAYAIYDVVDGEPNHVMDVGNFTNVYAYNPADFDGYGTVAAVFEGKGRDMEDLAFSNLTAEVLDVGEVSSTNFSVYPNPTNGTFTVEGAKTLTVYNAIGQVVARSDNNEGKHSLSLAPGVYFIKCDEGSVQKVVVE